MGAGAVALALGLVVWAACLQAAAGCGFPLITDAAGRAVPDAFVQITAAPRAGGAAVQRGVFLGKVAAFGPCPPAKADAVSLPVRLANASGAPCSPRPPTPCVLTLCRPAACALPGVCRVGCVWMCAFVCLSGCLFLGVRASTRVRVWREGGARSESRAESHGRGGGGASFNERL